MRAIHKSICILNYDLQQIITNEIPNSFDEYVNELISHISKNTSVREYKTRSNSTEVVSCILSILANKDCIDLVNSKINTIAHRLLSKEAEAQGKIDRTNTTVQKGSLIQALLLDETTESYNYLLAKVEHSEWVDDADFTFKTGFSKNRKTLWKSCLFDLTDLSNDIFYAKVYSDTRAKYWSDGFLELDEVNNDEKNTARAFQAIEATLGYGFKGIVSPDHTMIRNDFVTYLRKRDHIDYNEMIEEVLGKYEPIDPKISKDKIRDIKAKLLEQPQKRNFDCQFTPVNSAINARIRRIYKINEGIELKVSGDIKDLEKTIVSVEENGSRYIKIRTNNNETFNRFNF